MVGRMSARGHLFQSTPPERGATMVYMVFSVVLIVSIHAPREGSDV